MELTGVAEAARWEEAGIQEGLWEKWIIEATSGLNDWLGRWQPILFGLLTRDLGTAVEAFFSKHTLFHGNNIVK
jgi:hypothetical protein